MNKVRATPNQPAPDTGNDDFGARKGSQVPGKGSLGDKEFSRLGRWLSADWSSVPVPVPYANLSNPQTLNLYAMVSDNPETFADLDGHCGQVVAAGAPTANVSVPCDGNPNSPANGANAAQAGNSAQQTGTGVGQSTTQQAVTIYSYQNTETKHPDGTISVVQTITTATFSTAKGQEGKFLGATTQTVTFGVNPDLGPTNYHGGEVKAIGYGQAVHAMGADQMERGVAAAFPTFAGQFARAVGRDIQAHPVRYLIDVGGLAAGPALGLGAEADGIITAIHALHSAKELEKEMHGGGSQ